MDIALFLIAIGIVLAVLARASGRIGKSSVVVVSGVIHQSMR